MKRYRKNNNNITIKSNNLNSAIYLIIVESPSKCSKIEGFLGSQYACIASLGHLRCINGLKQINTKDKFQPNFSIIENKENHVSQMKAIISKFNESRILLATDDDREGECIAWHICELFQFNISTISRIKFHEITKSAIVKAVNNPTTIDMDIVNSAIARQVLDVIVGFKISPLLWTYLYNNKDNPLSAGRCQTPALRLVYENDKLDRNNSSYFYKIKGKFSDMKLIFTLNATFDENELSLSFIKKNKKFEHILSKGKIGKKIDSSPQPFSTSNLLQYACNTLSLNSQKIMQLCQELYQKGYITYMRTDSKKYSPEFIQNCHDYISDTFGDKYKNEDKNIVNSNKNNPHEAIRVTHIYTKNLNEANPKLNSLYKIIWKNTIESCMKPAEYKTVLYHLSSPDDLHYDYKHEIPIFLGWKILQNNKSDTDNITLYLDSKINQVIPFNEIYSECCYHGNTPYYNESSLVKTLEKIGIGRPSTFASIIQTLIDRNYVNVTDIEGQTIEVTLYQLQHNNKLVSIKKNETHGSEKRKLKITNIGIMALEFLCNNFNDLFSYDYTSKMEDDLDKICSKEISEWFTICKTCYNDIGKLSKNIKSISKHGFQLDETHIFCFEKYGPVIKKISQNDETPEYFKVKPEFHNIDIDAIKNYSINDMIQRDNNIGKYKGHDILIKNGKYGPYIECNDVRETIKNIDPNNITLEQAIQILESKNDNSSILRTINENFSIRKGKYGPYIFYKTDSMPKPKFLNLKKFPHGYLSCDADVLLHWISQTYKIQ
tara:strand:+ start:22 stop:2346 length:2325 start_codon:yes stop_codon:yes gene_type:complete